MTPSGLFVGLATLDVVQLVDRLPAGNEKTVAERTWLAAGGPAAVAAITFAALGGRARLWTALGSAPAARLAASDLVGAGVEVIDVAPPGFELAVSTVFLDASTGDRAVVSGSGHTPAFGKIAGPDLSAVDVVLVDGHHAALARSAVLAALPTSEERAPAVPLPAPEERAPAVPLPAPEERAPASVTKGRPPIVVDAGSHKPVFDELFPFATDVICSADYLHPDGTTPRELLELGPELVVVSHGGAALDWWTHNSAGTITPDRVPAIDTVGAGDVLHGAYCFGLASGLDREQALRRAVAVATERVRHLGPFDWRSAIGKYSH